MGDQFYFIVIDNYKPPPTTTKGGNYETVSLLPGDRARGRRPYPFPLVGVLNQGLSPVSNPSKQTLWPVQIRNLPLGYEDRDSGLRPYHQMLNLENQTNVATWTVTATTKAPIFGAQVSSENKV